MFTCVALRVFNLNNKLLAWLTEFPPERRVVEDLEGPNFWQGRPRYDCLNETHLLPTRPDCDVNSVYGEAVSFLSRISRELAYFSQPVDKL